MVQRSNVLLPSAEARKSPTVDGKVERNSDGKEVRFPVILTYREKEIARRIVLVFKQFVCGFDILRVQEGHSVVSCEFVAVLSHCTLYRFIHSQHRPRN